MGDDINGTALLTELRGDGVDTRWCARYNPDPNPNPNPNANPNPNPNLPPTPNQVRARGARPRHAHLFHPGESGDSYP